MIAKRREEALESFEKAKRLAPDEPSSSNDVGEAYRQLGRVDEAEKNFRAALELKPDYAAAHYNLALTFLETGKTAQAVEHFEHYLALEPTADDAGQVREWIDGLAEGDAKPQGETEE